MPGELWTDEELRAALEAYIFVQRLEQAGLVIEEERLVALLQDGPLPSRNSTSIRFRMRNLSAVFRDLGRPTIGAYPPAVKVGTGVQARIEAMLAESPQSEANAGALSLVQPQPLSREEARARAKRALADLADALGALDPPAPGIGHNRPPEPVDPDSASDDLKRAVTAVEDLRKEISSQQPNATIVRANVEELANFGTKRAAWFRERGTKAIDSAIGSAIPVIMLGMALLLVNAITAVLRFLSVFP